MKCERCKDSCNVVVDVRFTAREMGIIAECVAMTSPRDFTDGFLDGEHQYDELLDKVNNATDGYEVCPDCGGIGYGTEKR